MKQRWLILLLFLGVVLSLLAGCTTRVTPSTGDPAGPSAPTAAPTAPSANAAPSQPVAAGPTETPPPLPPAMAGPVFTVQGTLESGIPWGTTADGNYFKGDPKAPLVMFEFSDFQ